MAEDLGSHQLERLVELLTLRECQDLRDALARPEEDVLQHLQRLSPENNDLGLGLQQRQRRDASGESQLYSFELTLSLQYTHTFLTLCRNFISASIPMSSQYLLVLPLFIP